MQDGPDRDPLTGLLSHAGLIQAFLELIEGERSTDTGIGFLYVAVDAVRPVRDVPWGQAVDGLAVEVARRLRTVLRSTDIAARLGGGEFGIVVTEGGDSDGLGDFARRLRTAIGQPWRLGEREITVDTSIGSSVSLGSDASNLATLMGDARRDMLQARQEHRRGSRWSTEAHGLDAREATAALRSGTLAGLRESFGRFLDVAGRNESQDERDFMISLTPFVDCARRLGLDAATALGAVIATAPERLQEVFVVFARRTDVTLEAFSWSVVDTPEGPAYRFAWPPGPAAR